MGPEITENVFNNSVRALLIQTQAEGVVAGLILPSLDIFLRATCSRAEQKRPKMLIPISSSHCETLSLTRQSN